MKIERVEKIYFNDKDCSLWADFMTLIRNIERISNDESILGSVDSIQTAMNDLWEEIEVN